MSDYDSDDSVDDGGWDDYDGGTQVTFDHTVKIQQQ